MAVRIRLTRMGAKKRPFYRIVAADSEAPRDGKYLEILGTYDPNSDPAQVTLKAERLEYWFSHGASPSDTVASLLKAQGLWPPAGSKETVAAS